MPPYFLENIAKYLIEHHGADLSGIAVVFPNRRAGLFMRKYLAGLIPKTTWSPAIFSIEDFIKTLSGLKEVEPIHCLIELYIIHRETEKDKAQPFGDFIHWGAQLLTDFNEVDQYLVDPKKLFTYLDEVKILTVWNPANQTPTEFQLNYLKFFHSLLNYYIILTTRLLARGEGYQGLMFRHASEILVKEEQPVPWDHIYFSGFNAMTGVEEKILDYLAGKGIATLLWDADRYYLDHSGQEAGDFLRKWHRKWPMTRETWITDEFKSGTKEIRIVGVPGMVGQVKVCSELLREIPEQNQPDERTAVVLPDERLLLPLLHSIPDKVKDVNITMGLPLSLTPIAELLDLVLLMHLNPGRMKRKKADTFYYLDILRILRHPYISKMASVSMKENKHAFTEMMERITSGGRVFLRKDEIIGAQRDLFTGESGFLEQLFTSWNSLEDMIQGLQSITGEIVTAFRQEGPGSEEQAALEGEYAFAVAKILHQLKGIVGKAGTYLTGETFYQFFRQMLASTSLPFYGEPLKGVQIMGMLETRNLDFDQVIMLSCNEGILPSARSPQSLIPFDVRREFHLPTFQQKDAVYAYHYYRLLQRARFIHLIYNTEPDQLGGGEPSRFIRQLITELPYYNPGISIHESMVDTPLQTVSEASAIVIPKTGAVMEKLMTKADAGFAPTALNGYRACPLRFYYSEIAGLKESEEIKDEIDPQSLGKAVHDALKNLYSPSTGQALSPDTVQMMIERIDQETEKAFQKIFKGESIGFGKNLLLVQVAKIMIRRFIRNELEFVQELAVNGENIRMIMLEKPLMKTVTISCNGSPLKVKLKGFVDRIDKVGDMTRVIDYKTGKAEQKELQVKDWEELITNHNLDKGFQLLMYAYLLANPKHPAFISAGIISLRRPSAGMIEVTVPGDNTNKKVSILETATLTMMEEILTRLLQDIYNPAIPFQQTTDPDRCSRCPYIPICGR